MSSSLLAFASNFDVDNSLDPETTMSSHLTITTFCPANNSFATMEARRPRRWSRPSMMIVDSNIFPNIQTSRDRGEMVRLGWQYLKGVAARREVF